MSDEKTIPHPKLVEDALGRSVCLKVIADNVRRARNGKKMSLQDVAVKCGLERSQIGRMERGLNMPTLETLIRVAVALDTTVAELLKGAVP